MLDSMLFTIQGGRNSLYEVGTYLIHQQTQVMLYMLGTAP